MTRADFTTPGVSVVRVSAGSGRVTMVDPVDSVPDRLLTGPEVARLLGIDPSTWRQYVRRGYAPKPDDPDADRPVNRRMPRWRVDTVARYRAERKGQGHRSDLPVPVRDRGAGE